MTQPTPTDFAVLDIRIARIVDVEPFPEARKPVRKLILDVGNVGILRSGAQITNYSERELIGRMVVVVTNLGTRRIASFTSECLVLASISTDGLPILLAAGPEAQPGDRIA